MRVPSSDSSGSASFNMTPMIDVVFLLIIFFLVSSHLAKQETQMDLDLPRAGTGDEAVDDAEPRLIVNVTRDGQILLGANRVAVLELPQRMQAVAKSKGPDVEIRIRASRQVPYPVVEPILTACARAGIWDVNFAVYERGN